MHAEESGNEQRVTKTAHRKQFRDALQHAQKDQKRQAHASVLLKSGEDKQLAGA
jgi:hypothetical protein